MRLLETLSYNSPENFIHNCPVPGCDYGNDQKDSIVSHIIRNHKDEDEWIQKAHQQNWLRCKNCIKFFTSIKGKNKHEMKCGTPKIKLNCIFENCHKTYTTQEAMDQHVEVTHHGKGHKTLCPPCGEHFSSQQSLNRNMENKHQRFLTFANIPKKPNSKQFRNSFGTI